MEPNRRLPLFAIAVVLPLAAAPLSGCGTAVVAGAAAYGVTKVAVKTTVGTAKLVGKGVKRARERSAERRAEREAAKAQARYEAELAVRDRMSEPVQDIYTGTVMRPVPSGLY